MNQATLKTMTSHKSVNWRTPAATYAELDAEFHFDFDPCPLNSDFDGLVMSWQGKRVYCNPPYGPEIIKFLQKAREADVAVYLLPARTDTKWFHDLCLPYASEIRFIRGRLRFGNSKHGAPFPSMVVVFKGIGTLIYTRGEIFIYRTRTHAHSRLPRPTPSDNESGFQFHTN